MNEKPEQHEVEQTPTTIDVLLNSPDIQKAISKIPDLIQATMDARRRQTVGTAYGIILLVLLIIGGIVALGILKILSSDSVAFLFGTVIGASFTFLRDLARRA